MRKVFLLFFLIPAAFLDASCPFCHNEVIEKQYIAETKLTWTLYCLTPTTVGNVMVIPKRHIERFEEYSDEELIEMKQAIQKITARIEEVYGISEYVIIQKNGKQCGGQSVLHSHFHVIPAPIPFEQIVDTAFHFRERISDEEMSKRTAELRQMDS